MVEMTLRFWSPSPSKTKFQYFVGNRIYNHSAVTPHTHLFKIVFVSVNADFVKFVVPSVLFTFTVWHICAVKLPPLSKTNFLLALTPPTAIFPEVNKSNTDGAHFAAFYRNLSFILNLYLAYLANSL